MDLRQFASGVSSGPWGPVEPEEAFLPMQDIYCGFTEKMLFEDRLDK